MTIAVDMGCKATKKKNKWVCLQFVSVVFPDHAHLLFLTVHHFLVHVSKTFKPVSDSVKNVD